jgi:GNAT superfamily N-acetyltransferase
MTYEIVPVSDKRRMRDFLLLPFALYRDDPLWVPPLVSRLRRTLDPQRNPYFANASLRLFLCLKDGTPAARMAVVIDDRHRGRRSGNGCDGRLATFGFFESVDDVEAVRRIFEAAETYARSQGASSLEGPFNPHHYSELGLQIDRFGTPPSFFQSYNPPTYPALLEKTGFRVAARLQTMRNAQIREFLEGRYRERPDAGTRHGYIVRPISARHFRRDLEILRDINNDAFAANWRFLPLDREEFAFAAEGIRLVSPSDLILFVEHHGRPVAALHSVLDVNPALRRLRGRPGPLRAIHFLAERRRIRTIIVFSVAIRRDHRHSRVYFALLTAFARIARRFDALETTWVSPGNVPSVRAAESLGAAPDKTFAIYAKELRP